MSAFETEWETPEFDSVPMLADGAVYLLPGCDDTTLRKTLLWAYRDFCKRSGAIRTWRKIPLVAGQAHYPVPVVVSDEIDCVTQVVFAHSRAPVGGWRVEGDPPVLHLGHGFAWHEFVPGVAAPFVQTKLNVGALPVEAKAGKPVPLSIPAVWVEAVEVPSMGEENAPKAFLRRYGDAIVDGALARLMSMGGRQWADAEQARQHGVAYENAIAEARHRSLRGGPGANPSGAFSVDMSGAV